MTSLFLARLCGLCAAGLLLALAGGCSAVRQTAAPPPSYYSLDSARGAAPSSVLLVAPAANQPTVRAAAPTLIINPPHAAAGFDSQRMIYVRQTHKLEYFAHNEWIDTPARMLAPLIVAAIDASGTFRAVVLTPSAAAGDLRLDTEIVRLQQDFGSPPSRVRFTLRAYIVDNRTRRVLAWREFDETAVAASEDPYGGVVAANRAVQSVLARLAGFCAEAAGNWQLSAAKAPE